MHQNDDHKESIKIFCTWLNDWGISSDICSFFCCTYMSVCRITIAITMNSIREKYRWRSSSFVYTSNSHRWSTYVSVVINIHIPLHTIATQFYFILLFFFFFLQNHQINVMCWYHFIYSTGAEKFCKFVSPILNFCQYIARMWAFIMFVFFSPSIHIVIVNCLK